MGPVEISTVYQNHPWWVGVAVGVATIPILLFLLWKWFLQGRSEVTVAQLAATQGGIYKDSLADTKGIIDELRSQRDAAESRNTELVMRLADLTDRMVDVQKAMETQSIQIEMQARQIVTQARHIEDLTAQIVILEGKINATPA